MSITLIPEFTHQPIPVDSFNAFRAETAPIMGKASDSYEFEVFTLPVNAYFVAGRGSDITGAIAGIVLSAALLPNGGRIAVFARADMSDILLGLAPGTTLYFVLESNDFRVLRTCVVVSGVEAP